MAKKTFVDGAGLQRFKQNLDSQAVKAHQHSASDVTSGTLPVARGGTGLTASPSLLVNLAGTSAAAVFAASPRPGVTGTLPVANGGTGATSASAARTALGITPQNIGAALATHYHGLASDDEAGFMPALTGNTASYLRADGEWAQIPVATENSNGLFTAGEKQRLAAISQMEPYRAVVTDANGRPVESAVTSTELGYLDGVTGPVQTQLNGKASTSHTHTASQVGAAASSHTHTAGEVTGLTASRALVSNADGSPSVSAVTATELGYLDGVTSNIQTQLNGKAASSHTHAATQVTGLTASRALVSNSSGQPAVSAVTSTELSYLDGVTSNVQTQLNAKAASSHSHSAATTSAAGFMAAADKAKLDALTPITTSEIDALFAE